MMLRYSIRFSKNQIKLWMHPLKHARFYLSPAYACMEKWNERLKDPFIKDIKPIEFYYDLIKKYKNEGKVSAIDADLFFGSAREQTVEDYHEEMEEILRLLRRSGETIHTLPSTPHNIMRAYLEGKKHDLILKILSDPLNYGVFPDFYLSNHLMDTFLKENNFMAAARVASIFMLQEDYGPPLSKALTLVSCFKYALNGEQNEEWVDFNPVFEPEEEVKVVVPYIRNHYFDDHFDIKEPMHVVGKTLAWLSPHLEEPFKTYSELLGWGLYEKWNKLHESVEKLSKDKCQLDEELFTLILSQVEKCKEEELKVKLQTSLAIVKNQGSVDSKLNIVEKIEELVTQTVQQYEETSVKDQEYVYNEWTVKRKEAVEKQIELYERNRLIAEIEEKKKDLEEREEVIYFFDNKQKLEMLIPRKKKHYPKVLSLIFPKKKKRTVDAEYVPPEIIKRR